MNNDKEKSEKNNLNKDYSSLSKQELLDIAKDLGLKSVSKLNKAELKQKIEDFEAEKLRKEEEKIPNYKKSPYAEKTKQDLIVIAKDLNIKNYSRLTKPELIKAIERKNAQGSKQNVEVTEINDPEVKEVVTEDHQSEGFIETARKKLQDLFNLKQAQKKEQEETKSVETEPADKADESQKPEEKAENDLTALSMSSLVGMAKDLKVKGYSRLNKLKLIKSISEIKDSIVHKAEEIKDGINENIESISTNISEKVGSVKESVNAGIDSINESITNTKEVVNHLVSDVSHIVSEMKDAFNEDPNKVELDKLAADKSETTEKIEITDDAEKTEDNEKVGTATENLNEEKAENDSAENIEKIAQGVESPYLDKREAAAIEKDLINRVLLTPSKFGFGKTNEQFLLKDEENIELPALYEEDKVTLLPVDPTKMFVYWDISSETIDNLVANNIRDFYIRVNDVTGILYNGYNANLFWMERCQIEVGDWYIYPQQGGRNFCVELGYVYQGEFNILARSNTIKVAPGKASNVVADTFVITNYPKINVGTGSINKEYASDRYVIRNIEKRETPYYELNDYRIAENYNTKRMARKMPSFVIDEIPEYFVKEYSMTGPQEAKEENILVTAPEKLPAYSEPVDNHENNQIILIPEVNNHSIKAEENYYIEDENINSYIRTPRVSEETINISEPLVQIRKDIPETIYSYFESIPGFSQDKILVDSYFYQLPGEPQKAMRVYYEWVENEIPYRKEFFWISDTFPQIHQNIYKISWGPTWSKEYIGGSEQLKYLGASERFLGSSDIYLGGSEYFIESSGRYMGASENMIGGSENYQDSGEKYIDLNNKFIGSSENMIGGSENYHSSEEITSLFSDEFIIKSNRNRVQDYKGIKDRYKL